MVQSTENANQPTVVGIEKARSEEYNTDDNAPMNSSDTQKDESARKKRNRPIISCTSCRRKKIKCDRAKPICSSCYARGYPLKDCIYNETKKVGKTNSKQRKGKTTKLPGLDIEKIPEPTVVPDLTSLGTVSSNHMIPDKTSSGINNNSYLQNKEFQKLNNELNDINHRRQLLEHVAKNIESEDPSISTDYMHMKMDLLYKENEILKQLNSNLYNYSVNTLKNIHQSNPAKEFKKVSSDDNNRVERNLANHRIVEMGYQPMENCILFKQINASIIHFMRFKPNRTIYFGPTCFRSAIAYNSNFAQIYHFISKLTTKDRKKFKNSRKFKFLDASTFFPFNIDTFQDGSAKIQKHSLHLTDNGNLSADNDFMMYLINILPRYQRLVELINIFFDKYIHHLFPIVQRKYVFDLFNQVFVLKTPEEKINIMDDNKNDFKFNIVFQYRDFSRISLILAFIRLSLLFTDEAFDSINTDIQNSERSKVEGLLGYYSMKLLSSFNFLKKPLVTSLQALLMLKIHSMYDLDDGEGGDTSDGYLMNSIAYHMAIMCGLHRNVDENYQDFSTEFREMLKNIWKYCIFVDWRHSFQLGYPLSMDDILFSENSTRKVFDCYNEVIDECEINRQMHVVIDYAKANISSNDLLYEYILPVLRNLNYQLNNLKFKNLSVFKLELYIQGMIQLFSNTKVFGPLYESFTNPLAQANQFPKNEFKFSNFLKRIEIQLILIDVIFTLYNLILMILQKLDNSKMKDPNLPKLINFYANQTVNFAIFSMKIAKKFLSLKAKDKVFQTYLFSDVKQLIYRISLFVYSDLLFSFGGPNATNHKTIRDFSNNLNCYFSLNKKMIKNIRATDNDTFMNICSINALTDNDLNNICFSDNQYELITSENCLVKQYTNFMDFVTHKYTYYNFYNRKLDISNLIFEFYSRTVKDNLRHYYVFYVLYNISMHFYTYLKERNLVRSISYEEESKASDSNGIDSNISTNIKGTGHTNLAVIDQSKLNTATKIPPVSVAKKELINTTNHVYSNSPNIQDTDFLKRQTESYKQEINNIVTAQAPSMDGVFMSSSNISKGNIALPQVYSQPLNINFQKSNESTSIPSTPNFVKENLNNSESQFSSFIPDIVNGNRATTMSMYNKASIPQSEETVSSNDYSPLDLLNNEFYIDMNELFERINSQQ